MSSSASGAKPLTRGRTILARWEASRRRGDSRQALRPPRERSGSAIDDVLTNNAGYAEGFVQGNQHAPPAKNLAVVACMDARLDTHKLLGLKEGDAHVMRNAGGVVSDDVIRSLVISQRLLGTREIMLIHPTDCGMLGFRDDDVKDAIEADTGLRPAFALEAFRELEQDVRQSIARIQASPFIPLKDQVRGFIYDCATGQLNEVDAG